jgi:beta-lactamase regulating signal transducer with metallopeptidase domain
MIETLNGAGDWWWSWLRAMAWQAALLALVVWAVDLGLRRRGWPQVRYALWAVVVVKLLIPPAFALPSGVLSRMLPAGRRSTQVEAAQGMPSADLEGAAALESRAWSVPAAGPGGGVPARDAGAGAAARVRLSASAWAMLGSGVVSLVLLAWLAARALGLRRLVRVDAGQGLPERMEGVVGPCAQRLGLRRVPRVVVTEGVRSAAVFGVFRPVLLLPPAACEAGSAVRLEHIVLHELAHVKRGDLAANTAQALVQVVFWFHPAVWLAGMHMRHLRELCCDASVSRLLRERTSEYRETLAEAARAMLLGRERPGLGLLGLFESASRLRRRLEHLERPAWRHARLKAMASLAAAALMVACVVPMAGNTREANAESSAAPTGGRRALTWQATLPNGVAVELLALWRYADESEQEREWWRPDGTTMSPEDCALYADKVSDPAWGLQMLHFEYGYLYRIDPEADVSTDSRPTWGSRMGQRAPREGIVSALVASDNWDRQQGLVGETTGIAIAAAAGPWESWECELHGGDVYVSRRLEGGASMALSGLRPEYSEQSDAGRGDSPGDARQANGRLQYACDATLIDVTENAGDIDVRVLYEEKDGDVGRAQSRAQMGVVAPLSQSADHRPMVVRTFCLPSRREDLASVFVEWRPLHAVAFRNVAMVPGLTTEVHVEPIGPTGGRPAEEAPFGPDGAAAPDMTSQAVLGGVRHSQRPARNMRIRWVRESGGGYAVGGGATGEPIRLVRTSGSAVINGARSRIEVHEETYRGDEAEPGYINDQVYVFDGAECRKLTTVVKGSARRPVAGHIWLLDHNSELITGILFGQSPPVYNETLLREYQLTFAEGDVPGTVVLDATRPNRGRYRLTIDGNRGHNVVRRECFVARGRKDYEDRFGLAQHVDGIWFLKSREKIRYGLRDPSKTSVEEQVTVDSVEFDTPPEDEALFRLRFPDGTALADLTFEYGSPGGFRVGCLAEPDHMREPAAVTAVLGARPDDDGGTAGADSRGQGGQWGPVLQRTVNGVHSGRGAFIDLESANVADMPEAVRATGRGIDRWLEEEGIDGRVEMDAGLRGLWGFRMVVIPVRNERWDTVWPAQCESALSAHEGIYPPIVSAAGGLPATCLFKTGQGSAGILQIVGVTADHEGLAIRYKMVQPAPTPAGATVE